ncbi:MAG TPA: hypothetical protein VN915_12605 [Elusimicrobiota bacterium]|nr:hypothetical protein [Elusimicrobiota bacterium]
MAARPSPRRSWSPGLLALAALAALAAASRAAAAELPRARPAPSAVEDLDQGAVRPDDFKRVLEGSLERRGDVDAPDVLARGAAGRAAAIRLSRPERAPRPGADVAPPTSPALAPRAGAAVREVWTPDLKTRKLAAALGLGLLLIAVSWLETPRELEADGPAGAPEPPPPFRGPLPAPPRAPGPDLAPARLAEALAEPDYVDTRMPAATWRAISWREQSLIESWDASPEKSAGAASLAEWLDAKGGAAGVDVPLLKAKLFRDA